MMLMRLECRSATAWVAAWGCALILAASAAGLEAAEDWRGLPYMRGFEPAAGLSGRDLARDRIDYFVRRAGTLQGAGGRTLLPAGTVLDRFVLDAHGEATVHMTLGAGGAGFELRESDAAALDELLAAGLGSQLLLAGMNLYLRVPGGDYLPLSSFMPAPVEPPQEDDAFDGGEAGGPQPGPAGLRVDSQALGGPIANAEGQPAGALSGVVVFCTAGHGWTQAGSSWSLQRPLLLRMNEDYGNLDQLNYLVHYLLNAGATVVPFRPVGYQPVEAVLDNDDAGVTFTGPWNNSMTTGAYYENGTTNSGVPYRWAAASLSETAVARYAPVLPRSDFYPVYCWVKHDTDRVPQMYRIRHSGGTAVVTVDHARVGRGWVWLGNYYFTAGAGGWVEISNQSPATGVVIADAIRFGNGMGDVVRPGPDRASGFPREEECMRYWAHSELGNKAVGFSSTIWDSSDTDSNDNVSTGARWAREMNRTDINNDRWRRIYVEFHSNAAGGSARGCLALYNTGSGATTHQLALATLLGEKLERDLLAVDDLFEFDWQSRNPNTYHASFDYGAINAAYNSNEFDATILEVGFHDNAEDAALLRDAKVRDAIARSTVQGLVEFLSDPVRFPGTAVPRVFLPDAPVNVRATHDGNGRILVSWQPGSARPESAASGDPATGYKVYRSADGYGFGDPRVVGDVSATLLDDIPADTTVYLRVAAVNAGGESMPSATLAVRRPLLGPSGILIVDGYDRVDREQNVVQRIPAGDMERPIPRRVNSFDYVVQHARALAQAGRHFDSCANEAVAEGSIALADYAAVVWILGRESAATQTLDPAEQSLLTAYLNNGGRLFATGSEIGYHLDGLNGGRAFYEGMCRANFLADNAGTYQVAGSGILADVGAFDFDPARGAAYPVPAPDQIAPLSGGSTILSYAGGTGGAAGVRYDSGVYRVVLFGFPFEAISAEPARSAVMQRVIDSLTPAAAGGCPHMPEQVAHFEGYAPGATVTFQNPRYSSSTQMHLAMTGHSAYVTNEVPAFNGLMAGKVEWRWLDAHPSRWLRLTTANTVNRPNPTIDLLRVVRVRVRVDGPADKSFRLCIGIRETGMDRAIGADGGTEGTIEWVGASGVLEGSPQGLLVTGRPGEWQTLTFVPRSGLVQPYTGDGVLYAAHDKGVLEHLAFSAVDSAGPFVVYVDGIDQPCSAPGDFDGDGDVDLVDFGHLQACLTGVGRTAEDGCRNASLDGDADVDPADVALFRKCFTGERVPADPACATW